MDRVERLVRGSRPGDEQLSLRAEVDLARILNSPTTPNARVAPSSRSAVRAGWILMAATLVVVLVITGMGLFHSTPAVAATPPMLMVTPAPGDAASALRELQVLAAEQVDRSAEREIATQWWGLASDVDAGGRILGSRVEPRRRVAQLGKHGVASYTDYTAQAYDVQGRPTTGPDIPAVGTKLETTTLDPDQQVFVKEPPRDPTKVGAYLSESVGASSESAAVNAFSGIGSLLAERIVNPAQTAALLGHLSTLSDVSLVGSSTDRLGRSVIVFASPVENDNQMLLLVSPETGGVAGTEVIYRGHRRTDIPSPAVTEYVVWEEA